MSLVWFSYFWYVGSAPTVYDYDLLLVIRLVSNVIVVGGIGTYADSHTIAND